VQDVVWLQAQVSMSIPSNLLVGWDEISFDFHLRILHHVLRNHLEEIPALIVLERLSSIQSISPFDSDGDSNSFIESPHDESMRNTFPLRDRWDILRSDQDFFRFDKMEFFFRIRLLFCVLFLFDALSLLFDFLDARDDKIPRIKKGLFS